MSYQSRRLTGVSRQEEAASERFAKYLNDERSQATADSGSHHSQYEGRAGPVVIVPRRASRAARSGEMRTPRRASRAAPDARRGLLVPERCSLLDARRGLPPDSVPSRAIRYRYRELGSIKVNAPHVRALKGILADAQYYLLHNKPNPAPMGFDPAVRLPGGELKRGELTRIRRYANNPKQQLADKLKKVEAKKKKAERAASVAAMRRLEGKPPAPNPDLHRCCSNPKCFCNTFWREEGDDASVGSLGSLGSKKTLGSEGSRRKQHF